MKITETILAQLTDTDILLESVYQAIAEVEPNYAEEMATYEQSVQALLRDRLLQAYRHYAHQGYAGYDDKQNVLNIYTQYEALGPNSVMDQFHERFMALPDEPEGGHHV